MNGRALLPLLLLAVACSTEVAGRPAGGRAIRVAQPIVNGSPSTAADNAVVYIALGGPGSTAPARSLRRTSSSPRATASRR